MSSVKLRVGRPGRVIAVSIWLLVVSALAGIRDAPSARAASVQDHLNQLAKLGRNLEDKLRIDRVRDALSAGGHQLKMLADKVDQIKEAKANGARGRVQGPKPLPHGAGSDPFAAEDFVTRLSGMTQSETSVGWCGSNALIGFNDSGSFIATLFLGASPSGSLSFNGYSRSSNAGSSYTDMGALVADPLPAGIMFRDLLGDPVIGCTSPSTFYYASLAVDTGTDFSFFNSGISVSTSTNEGASFGPAVMAVAKDANFHFLDKPWMAVQPGPTPSFDDDVIHITYTDFDFSGFEGEGLCPGAARIAIEYVRSIDGGATWSSPQVLEELCDFVPEENISQFVQGSQVEAGVGSNVHVAWEHYEFDFDTSVETRNIRIAKSTNGGGSFGGPRIVTQVTPVGDGFVMQGFFRNFLDLQGLAVDRSTGPRRGAVYVSWQDGRNRSKPDPFAFCGGAPRYCFGDVLFTRSLDGGASWSEPVRVNDDNITLGIDQFQPGMDVDRSGNIWVLFYDRRRDTRNFLIDAYQAKSTNGGLNWTNSRITSRAFAPVTGWQDIVVNPFYMGDYIAVATDATGTLPGAILAWGDNSRGDANVLQRRT
jgi:hypothetical protein